jgi:hypothetical protein
MNMANFRQGGSLRISEAPLQPLPILYHPIKMLILSLSVIFFNRIGSEVS